MSSGSSTKLYAILAIVIIVAVSAVAGIIFLQPPADNGNGDTGDALIEVIGSDGTTEDLTLSELQAMTVVSRESSFQNSYGNVRGQGTYKGAKIAEILDEVGGMTEDQLVIINASDGYAITFTYDNVYPDTTQYEYQGDMVLAYEYNETVIPDYEDGPRLMFLPEDGYFSNDDAQVVMDPIHGRSAAGPHMISNVAQIKLVDIDLEITVEGHTYGYALENIMDMDSLTGSGGYKKRTGSLSGPFDVEGIDLFTFLNDTFGLPDNYNVTSEASDGWTVDYNETLVEGSVEGYDPDTGNSVGIQEFTMVLIYKMDGSLLDPADDGPFRIGFINEDGYYTDGFLWSKAVISLTVVET